jgi:solute carrier family 25 (mitochondrial oxoglutarate transporter), member 11
MPYRGLVQTMTSIANKEGVKGLFQGFSPYYLRCGGQTLLMFMSVEWLRKMYQSIK